MMIADKFSEKDAEQLTELLNFVGEHAEFTLKQKEIIRYFGLLVWAQKELLPKMKAHIQGPMQVSPAPEAAAEPEQPKKKAGKKTSKTVAKVN